MLNSNYDESNRTLTFVFAGRLDSAASIPLAPEVEKKLAECSGPGPASSTPLQVVFDLNGVEFISSAFIRICMLAAARIKPGVLQMKNANPFIKKTIKISGLEDQLKLL